MCHVVIIEEDFLLADHIALVLEGAGAVSFAQATDETGAVEAARGQRPDLIVAEMRLASGSGRTAIGRIRDEHGAIPAIIVTGTPDAYDGQDDATIVLTKPVADGDLVDTFHRMIAGPTVT